MRGKFLGTRGTYPVSNRSVEKYGGSTPCVQLRCGDERIILDAGTGILGLNFRKYLDQPTINILLTHLHMDHIQGLGFFKPLFIRGKKINIWGPAGLSETLRSRLNRFLSPPIFPLPLRDIPCDLTINEIADSEFQIGSFSIKSEFVIHRGATVGYRITCDGKTLTYMPDHEPMIGTAKLYDSNCWLSGYRLAKNADILIHDAQYTKEEYPNCMGWGHSSIEHAINFARRAECKKLFLFHHDPEHSDKFLEGMLSTARELANDEFEVELARQGKSYSL